MRLRSLATTGLLGLGVLLTACSDLATAPDDQGAVQPSFRGGVSGGGGGGGGTTPKPGRIQTSSAAAVCDGGTTIGVTIRKGIQDRAEIRMAITGAPTAPALAPGESLFWTFTITDDATGARLLGYGTSGQYFGTTALITISGGTTTPGVHDFTFLAQNHRITTLPPWDQLLVAPAVETCRASMVVVAD